MWREKGDLEVFVGVGWAEEEGFEERWKIVVGVAPVEFGVKEEEWVGESLVRVPRKSGGESRSCWPAWTVSMSWTLGILGW